MAKLKISISDPEPSQVPVDETWPIERVTPYGRNARLIPQNAVDKVKASIKAYGFTSPILINPKGVIIAGHTRRRAAYELGLTEVPVRILGYLTPAQERALRLADNRTALETDWDHGLLRDELIDLLPQLDDPIPMGFGPDELTELLADKPTGTSQPGGEAGEKDFARMDGVVVELYMAPAAYARHKGTLLRWSLLRDIDINWPD